MSGTLALERGFEGRGVVARGSWWMELSATLMGLVWHRCTRLPGCHLSRMDEVRGGCSWVQVGAAPGSALTSLS